MTTSLFAATTSAVIFLLLMGIEHRFGTVAVRYVALALGSLALGYFIGSLRTV